MRFAEYYIPAILSGQEVRPLARKGGLRLFTDQVAAEKAARQHMRAMKLRPFLVLFIAICVGTFCFGLGAQISHSLISTYDVINVPIGYPEMEDPEIWV